MWNKSAICPYAMDVAIGAARAPWDSAAPPRPNPPPRHASGPASVRHPEYLSSPVISRGNLSADTWAWLEALKASPHPPSKYLAGLVSSAIEAEKLRMGRQESQTAERAVYGTQMRTGRYPRCVLVASFRKTTEGKLILTHAALRNQLSKRMGICIDRRPRQHGDMPHASSGSAVQPAAFAPAPATPRKQWGAGKPMQALAMKKPVASLPESEANEKPVFEFTERERAFLETKKIDLSGLDLEALVREPLKVSKDEFMEMIGNHDWRKNVNALGTHGKALLTRGAPIGMMRLEAIELAKRPWGGDALTALDVHGEALVAEGAPIRLTEDLGREIAKKTGATALNGFARYGKDLLRYRTEAELKSMAPTRPGISEIRRLLKLIPPPHRKTNTGAA